MKNNYNPDVLNCLANLSNDEVFTPTSIVNGMLDLLPKDIWKNKDAKFLDPCTKTGVFLREIVKRLDDGLKEIIPNKEERINHILKNQVYGIAITEITSLVSRRSLYCSKYANGKYSVCEDFESEDGNIRFKPMKHTWSFGNCIFCGANKSNYDRPEELESHAYEFIHVYKPEEVFNMKFDVIIGNPPYQLSDGGGTGSSAMPLYNKFVEQAMKLNPRYLTMIIPSRWFAGGKGLDDFRSLMLNSKNISDLVDYSNSADCFPGVTIAGGVCYFLWSKEHNGPCRVKNMDNETTLSETIRPLNEYDIFIRDNRAIEIIRKIKSFGEKTMDELVFSRNCFNLLSKETGHATRDVNQDYTLYSLNGKSYINKSIVIDRDNLVDKYKVIMTKAMSGGNKPSSEGNYLVISNTMRVLNPGEVCTETYLCLGSFDTEEEANGLKSYMKTKLFRFLLLQALTSINISKEKFELIPIIDFNAEISDEILYKKYNLTEEEIDLIETKIKPMPGGESNE